MLPFHRILLGLVAIGMTLLVASRGAATDGEAAEEIECVPAGHVVSLTGKLRAQSPGKPPRFVNCGDPVCVGDEVATGAASRAGVLVGDTLIHLDEESAAQVQLTPDAGVNVSVARGSVRVVDPGGDGPATRVVAAGAEGRVAGNDAEVHVLREKTGAYALLCEWDAPLPVTRGSQARTANPGECVVAKRNEPLYQAPGHAQRLEVLEATCNPSPSLSPLAHLDPLPIVSSPPPGDEPPLPEGAPFPPPSPCDDPGVNCAGGPMLVEPPPTEDPFPGGGGVFGGSVEP